MTTAIHLQQARTSRSCGQHCLAMLAGVPLKDAIRAVGHRGQTDCETILAAARKLGLKQKTRLWVLFDDCDDVFPDKCIMRVRKHGWKNWHWICRVDGVWHDPITPIAHLLDQYWQIVSLMEFE